MNVAVVIVHNEIATLMEGVRTMTRPWPSPHRLTEIEVTQTQIQILTAAAEIQTQMQKVRLAGTAERLVTCVESALSLRRLPGHLVILSLRTTL